jgi:hypothetical protein
MEDKDLLVGIQTVAPSDVVSPRHLLVPAVPVPADRGDKRDVDVVDEKMRHPADQRRRVEPANGDLERVARGVGLEVEMESEDRVLGKEKLIKDHQVQRRRQTLAAT